LRRLRRLGAGLAGLLRLARKGRNRPFESLARPAVLRRRLRLRGLISISSSILLSSYLLIYYAVLGKVIAPAYQEKMLTVRA